MKELIIKNSKPETISGIQDLIESKVLKNLNSIVLGHYSIEKLLKHLLKLNEIVILTIN